MCGSEQEGGLHAERRAPAGQIGEDGDGSRGVPRLQLELSKQQAGLLGGPGVAEALQVELQVGLGLLGIPERHRLLDRNELLGRLLEQRVLIALPVEPTCDSDHHGHADTHEGLAVLTRPVGNLEDLGDKDVVRVLRLLLNGPSGRWMPLAHIGRWLMSVWEEPLQESVPASPASPRRAAVPGGRKEPSNLFLRL